jgi:uncharacterized protein with GYD domain
MPRKGETTQMPTYISLARWTAQGAHSIKESPARLDAAKKSFAAAGIKVIGFYMVTGAHDLVIINDGDVEDDRAGRDYDADLAGLHGG